MNSIFRVLAVIALLAAMGVGCTGAVAAQENATANETGTNVSIDDARDALEELSDDGDRDRDDRADRGDPDASEDRNESTMETNGTAAGLANQRTIAFNNDANTSIVGWEFRDGRVTVALETDRRTGVTVSDALAGIGEDGAVQVPKTNQFLERDTVTRVTMDVSEYDGGHSVGVTVDGLTVRLSTEMDGDDNPLQYFGGESGLFAGMGLAVAMSGGATWFVLWREESGVIRA